MLTIAITGYDGGRLAELDWLDHLFVVRSDYIPASRRRRRRSTTCCSRRSEIPVSGNGGMRFVDEFRSATCREPLAADRRAGRARAPLQADGGLRGHTHAIYKHGVEDLLPDEIELVHGPGCPVCVIPMGRQDDAIAIAERPR